MNKGLLNRFNKRLPSLSIFLLVLLSFVILETAASIGSNSIPKSFTETQIVDLSTFEFSPNCIKNRQNDQTPIVKLLCKMTVLSAGTSQVSIVLSDFPAEKTPVYQKHLLYTLFTSSEL